MEIVTILALILGIIGGFKLLHSGMDFLDQHFDINGTILPYVSFILIFVLIVILVNLLGKSIKKVLDMTLLGNFDNLVGSIIGFLKWAFAISVIIWISSGFGLDFPADWTHNSFLFPFVEAVAPKVIEWLGAVFPFLEGMVDSVKEMLA